MFSINSGIDGLNEMLNGGMPDKSITALVGPAGSGKTILSLQVLYAKSIGWKKMYLHECCPYDGRTGIHPTALLS